MLTSPNFLFRVEIDKEPGDAAAQPHAVNDWELATRLSYFLWSSMPDEELFAHARQGDLHQPDVLEAQTRRMLKDPKSHALVENFADQWLLDPQPQERHARPGHVPDVRRIAAVGDAEGDGDCTSRT